MKLIKTDRRTNLNTDTLSDLLEIHVEGPSLQKFSPNEAVRLWWDDCCTSRRVNQAPRRPYKPRASSSATGFSSETIPSSSELGSSEDFSALYDFDSWFEQ